MKPIKPIGVDYFYREIFPGDTIKDADERQYFVLSNGGCKPTDGGNETTLHRLKDPTIVAKGARNYQDENLPAASAMKPQPRMRVCKLASAANITTLQALKALTKAGISFSDGAIDVISISADDVPAAREVLRDVPKAPANGAVSDAGALANAEVSPVKEKKATRVHRPNKSGLVYIKSISRSLGLPGGAYTPALRDAGIEVILRKGGNAVRIEDEARTREIMANLPEKYNVIGEGSRPNLSGRIELSRLVKKAKAGAGAAAALRDAGIQVAIEGTHTFVRVEDKPRVLDILAALPHPEPAPRNPRKASGPKTENNGRPNKSGYCRIDNLTRKLGLPTRGAIQLLRDYGLQITYGPTRNPSVRVEDRDTALQILAKNKDFLFAIKEKGVTRLTSLHVLTDPAKAIGSRSSRSKEKPDEKPTTSIQDFTDAQLVGELRRRGWSVDCSKCQSI
ncbi:MAG: hypothetical protein K6A62_04610 [Bacteroidales bacterium]|nr:hypothetical protein [Bacteroidales bacterium]